VIKLKIPAVLALAVASFAIVATGAAAPANTISLASPEGLEEYLVDQDGYALYYFSLDVPGSGTSSCGETCIHDWPPFYTGQVVIPPNLSYFDFGTIYREDGLAQTTYRGWPLYTFVNDYKAGDIKGEGRDGRFLAGPGRMPP
jgi:predicted lipoprotein with Yx(FWY)xxD motif